MSEDTTAFAIGDVVRLRSGGPLLTVMSHGAPGGCTVAWFAGDHIRTEWLKYPMLERAEPKAEVAR